MAHKAQRSPLKFVVAGVLLLVVCAYWVSSRSRPEGREASSFKGVLVAEDFAWDEVEKCGWKPNESLAGFCPGQPLKPVKLGAQKPTAADCSKSCCESATCIAWQFRKDVGCLQGGDVRLGMEKDGTPEWCEGSAPMPWQGERLEARHRGEQEVKACGGGWQPDSMSSQCFGLGPLRPDPKTARECMQACCADEACQTWQFRADKGCFYGGWVGTNCEKGNSLGAFVGRRKIVKGRTYTDHRGVVVQPVTPWPGL